MDTERVVQLKEYDNLYRCIILECHDSYVHVLTDQGDHLKIRSIADHKVGDSICFLEEDIIKDSTTPGKVVPLRIRKSMKAISALAAVLLIIFLVNFSLTGITYAVISLDINPSIELEINKSGEVIHVKGFNQEAIDLLSTLDLKGEKYEKAIDEIFNQALLLGYTIDQHNVLIAIAPVKTSTEDLIGSIEKNLSIYTELLNAEVKIGDQHSYSNENNHDMSLGRNLISNEHPDIDEDDLKNLRIKDIFDQIEKEDEEDYNEEYDEVDEEDEEDEEDDDE